MKRLLLLTMVFISSSLVSIASIGTYVSPATAQDHGLQNFGSIGATRSSERFFNAGRQQMEQEIHRLEAGSNVQTSGILRVDPAIFQEQQDLQQLEQQFLNEGRVPKNDTLSIELLNEQTD